jgi:hypothetical protein
VVVEVVRVIGVEVVIRVVLMLLVPARVLVAVVVVAVPVVLVLVAVMAVAVVDVIGRIGVRRRRGRRCEVRIVRHVQPLREGRWFNASLARTAREDRTNHRSSSGRVNAHGRFSPSEAEELW